MATKADNARRARAVADEDRSAKARRTLQNAAEGEGPWKLTGKDGQIERWWCAWCMEDFEVTRPLDTNTLECPLCHHKIADQFDPSDNDPSLWPIGQKAAFKKEMNMVTAATKERPPKVEKVINKCLCGCDGDTGGKWVPGHDAKYHGAERKVKQGVLPLSEFRKMFPSSTIKAESPNIAEEVNTMAPPKPAGESLEKLKAAKRAAAAAKKNDNGK